MIVFCYVRIPFFHFDYAVSADEIRTKKANFEDNLNETITLILLNFEKLKQTKVKGRYLSKNLKSFLLLKRKS